MKAFLDIYLPRILPESATFQAIAFQGKQDLLKQLPIKLKALSYTEDVRFLILHDKDSNDCKHLKQEILERCHHQTTAPYKVRIVCTELESWYLGDLAAVDSAFATHLAKRLQQKSKFRDPDALGNPKQELKKLIPQYQQISGSKRIAPYLDKSTNTSVSFRHFNQAISHLTDV